MKILLLLLLITFASCGPKSNEDIAKDLITEKLKATLPDFKKYNSLNFGTMGAASLPYEETGQYFSNIKVLRVLRDSIMILEKILKENNSTLTEGNKYKEKLQQMIDSASAKNERNKADKQAYTPEKLFKLTHAYTVEDTSGHETKTEDAFFIDKDFKKVVKVQKLY